jgi:branched-chain amino acid transport system ATP-binding protein
MLTVRDIVKAFGGVRAVDGVGFVVAPGALVGLIGPNGAGKTTLFNCLSGALRPDSGTIELDGVPVQGLAPHRIFARGLARTFQIPRPFPEMSVLENVMLAAKDQAGEAFWRNWISVGRVAAEERRNRARAMHWIDFVGLSDLAERPARVLSGGQRKLLELARVMTAEPKLVLLDEPAAGVAPRLLEQIIERIDQLNRRGVTFLLIEHNLDMVMRLCGHVLVMAQGRLLTEGTPEAVRADPRVVEAYLGGVPA